MLTTIRFYVKEFVYQSNSPTGKCGFMRIIFIAWRSKENVYSHPPPPLGCQSIAGLPQAVNLTLKPAKKLSDHIESSVVFLILY